jgi:DNA-binding response OmpR family regulator
MCTVLIAEDDKNIRDSLEYFLCIEGFDVLSAENGQKAYNLAVKNHPDIILSDVHMPVMNGFELASKIKTNPDTETIPLVFLTSDREVQKSNDIKDIIYKPFSFSDLLDLITVKLGC